MLFWLTLGRFWCSLVTSVTFGSNLSNIKKKIQKIRKKKKRKKYQKYPKINKNQVNLNKPKNLLKKNTKNLKMSRNLEKSENLNFFLKNPNKSLFVQKIWKLWKYKYFFFAKKNAILLVLPIEESSTRSLQSSQFQNPGWLAWVLQSSSSRSSGSIRTVLLLSNIGCMVFGKKYVAPLQVYLS